MENRIKLLKANFPIVTLLFYVFGFTYLSTYYFQFDISIVNYINLLDILFTTINYLVVLFLIYCFVEIGLYIFSYIILSLIFSGIIKRKIYRKFTHRPNVRVERYIEYSSDKYLTHNIKGLNFFLFVASIFLLLYLVDETLLVFSIAIPFLVIKIFQIIPKDDDKQFKEKVYQFLSILLFFVFLICFSYWGYIDGKFAKEKKRNVFVEFKEDGILYNTSSEHLNYMGETNQYIFLYNREERNTLVFTKSNIAGYKIKDTSLTKEEQELQQEEMKKKIKNFFKVE